MLLNGENGPATDRQVERVRRCRHAFFRRRIGQYRRLPSSVPARKPSTASTAIQAWFSLFFPPVLTAAAGAFGAATTAAPSMVVVEGGRFAWAPTHLWGWQTPGPAPPSSWPRSIKVRIP